MIIANTNYSNMFNSVAREFVGRVELLEGSTLLDVFEYDGALQSFTIEKTGDNTKFFGYGICQKATVKLRDKERLIEINKGQGLQIAHGIDEHYLYTYPIFYVDEVSRDENTNELTITAYDVVYKANSHKVKELYIPRPFTIRGFIHIAAKALNMPVSFENINDSLLNLSYTDDFNISGEETLREALDDAAEVLGAIYYLNNDWELTFKGLDVGGEPVLAVDKSKYFALTVKTAHTVQNVMSVTELGDNVSSSSGIEGETEYLRENIFLTLREDIGTILDALLSVVKGLTIYQYECKHRGNFLLEIGDKISLTTKDNKVINTYALVDSITYNGGLVGQLSWSYEESSSADSSSPSTIGDALKQTIAKVDKTKNEITLMAAELEEEMSQLILRSDSMEATVENMEDRVQAAITAEDVELLVSQGVHSVTTTTGFTFNEEGLTVSKSDSEISTLITEDGMTVSRNDTEMLIADSIGVQAVNLHANTYLIIGKYSRFEDMEPNRTGCFWVG